MRRNVVRSIWASSLAATILLPGASSAQVIRLAEITTREIADLDRNRTVVIVSGGILEQHGPYLPSFTDGYLNQNLAEQLADALVSSGWTVLVFPQIPLGTGGANEIGRKYTFPGTYAVRSTTLRSVFMDLASEFGEQGFRWLFVVHFHGAPNHNRALDQASAFFRDSYGGHMVNLSGFLPADPPSIPRAQEVVDSDGLSPHAGMVETSWLMHLRGDLVADDVPSSPDQTARSWDELMAVSGEAGWAGYFGAPRHATADFGERHWRALSGWYIDLARRILDGLDYSALLRRSELAAGNRANVEIDEAALAREREIEARQRAWLARQPDGGR
jgi:creatinine amidohydrolase/Fe(II)-dependent formamide hydrolase-like protein